ncbi:hypothetical protein K8366_24475 [Klebsiella aerogenes]|nr:hypothetical protein [Klebsiella aerogenes]
MATEYKSGRMVRPRKYAEPSDGLLLTHGSFRDKAQDLFCGVREGFYPVNWYVRLGFRVMYVVR